MNIKVSLGIVALLVLSLVLISCSKTTAPAIDTDLTEAVDSEVTDINPETAPVEAPPVISPIVVKAVITYPVSVYGTNGFGPGELEIKVGDSVTFTNKDPREKAVQIVFQNKNNGKVINGKVIALGEEETVIFNEPGNYSYWTVGYGIRGKLIVNS